MRHPYHRSPWVDVAAVVFVLALLGAPLAYLATDLLGGASRGGGGAVVASGGGAAPTPHASPPRAAWRSGAETSRSSPFAPRIAGRASASRASGSQAPFSASWRAQATPSLTTPDGSGSGSNGAFQRAGRDGPSGIASRGGPVARGHGSPGASSGHPDWVGAAREFGQSALALSRQLEQMDRDPVQRSLGPEAAPSEGTGRASGPSSAAQTNDNPPLPGEPVPVGDHLHWLLVAGLLWGVWQLQGAG